jgi:anti-sigma regulatory factor (Ser/Thr protein kinase)
MSSSHSVRPPMGAAGVHQAVFTPRVDTRPTDHPPVLRHGENGSGNNWPCRSYLEFAALPTAPSCARLHTRAMLAEWALAIPGDDADLVVSELTTNALEASAEISESPAIIRLWLLSDGNRLVVVVWDGSSRPPALTRAAVTHEHGRGLQIVAAVSSDWGWYGRTDMGGKCVWAEIRQSPDEFMA